MSAKRERRLIVPGLLLTALIFIGHYFLPMKRETLYPAKDASPILMGFTDPQSGLSVRWTDDTLTEWICDFRPEHEHGCSWQLDLLTQYPEGRDLSGFDALEVQLDVYGSQKRVRVSLQNYNNAYSPAPDSQKNKWMSMSFPVEEAKNPVLIELKEFSVATWWLQEYNMRRQWASPEFNAVTKIGFDFIEHGVHRARIHRVVLVGRWIETETLVFAILGFWMSVFLLDGLVRLFYLMRKAQEERNMIRVLEEQQRHLEEDRKSLRALADTDPLTGIYNRSGLESHLDHWFSLQGPKGNVGLMVIDIDHFKKINDTYGHDMGDEVLREVASIILANLRVEDTFARWGGEEFIVLSHIKSVEVLRQFADKLREIAGTPTFGPDANVKVTVSIGVALARPTEHFAATFKRADTALYHAKHTGRNRVEVAD